MAAIYIKGRRDPIQIANVKVITLRRMFLDTSVARETPVLAGNWSGTLAEIRSIETDESTLANRAFNAVPTWSDSQMAEFDKEIAPYRKISETRLGRGRWYYYAEFYLHDKGAIIAKVVYSATDPKTMTLETTVRNQQLYVDINHKIQAYKDWKGRMAYGDKKRAEQLNEVAVSQKSLLDSKVVHNEPLDISDSSL